jgi:hypothetical protein
MPTTASPAHSSTNSISAAVPIWNITSIAVATRSMGGSFKQIKERPLARTEIRFGHIQRMRHFHRRPLGHNQLCFSTPMMDCFGLIAL